MDPLIKFYRDRFDGRRVARLQLPVPQELMYPTFYGQLIKSAAQDLQ